MKTDDLTTPLDKIMLKIIDLIQTDKELKNAIIELLESKAEANRSLSRYRDYRAGFHKPKKPKMQV